MACKLYFNEAIINKRNKNASFPLPAHPPARPTTTMARKFLAWSQQSYEKEIGVDVCSIINYSQCSPGKKKKYKMTQQKANFSFLNGLLLTSHSQSSLRCYTLCEKVFQFFVIDQEVFISKNCYCLVRFKCNLPHLLIHAVCSKSWFCCEDKGTSSVETELPFHEA